MVNYQPWPLDSTDILSSFLKGIGQYGLLYFPGAVVLNIFIFIAAISSGKLLAPRPNAIVQCPPSLSAGVIDYLDLRIMSLMGGFNISHRPLQYFNNIISALHTAEKRSIKNRILGKTVSQIVPLLSINIIPVSGLQLFNSLNILQLLIFRSSSKTLVVTHPSFLNVILPTLSGRQAKPF